MNSKLRPAGRFVSFLVLALGVALVALAGCTSAAGNGAKVSVPETQAQSVDPAKQLENLHGITITGLGLTMVGSAVDFQYRVIYEDKALDWLHDEDLMPVLLDDDSGAKMPHPPTMMHTPNPQAGRIYHMLLPNTGGAIKQGDRVSVLIGDLRLGPIQAQ